MWVFKLAQEEQTTNINFWLIQAKNSLCVLGEYATQREKHLTLLFLLKILNFYYLLWIRNDSIITDPIFEIIPDPDPTSRKVLDPETWVSLAH